MGIIQGPKNNQGQVVKFHWSKCVNKENSQLSYYVIAQIQHAWTTTCLGSFSNKPFFSISLSWSSRKYAFTAKKIWTSSITHEQFLMHVTIGQFCKSWWRNPNLMCPPYIIVMKSKYQQCKICIRFQFTMRTRIRWNYITL